MKRDGHQSNHSAPDTGTIVRTGQHRAASYQRVRDERKRPIRGLWLRNDRYYAQLTVEEPETGRKRVCRVPLDGAATAAQAKQKLEQLLVDRRRGKMTVLKQAPKFAEFADQYLDYYKNVVDGKRASTLETEGHAIARLKEHMGHLRLNQIKRIHVDSFVLKRQREQKAARTVNLEVTVLRNVLNKAIDDKWITELPTANLRPLKSVRRKRPLASAAEIDRLCAVGFRPIFFAGRVVAETETGHPLQSARQFSDYIRLLCYSGARLSEVLQLRWADVDWQNRQLTIGADGGAKNRLWRVVDFNANLETHLKDMLERRVPDSEWLFPSPRRGVERDGAAKTFRETLIVARVAAGLPGFGFHDCRHYFISQCVMSGIDYMTIARWVGHQDGGVLIGKVYGHLSNEHAQRQAGKLVLGPTLTTGKAAKN